MARRTGSGQGARDPLAPPAARTTHSTDRDAQGAGPQGATQHAKNKNRRKRRRSTGAHPRNEVRTGSNSSSAAPPASSGERPSAPSPSDARFTSAPEPTSPADAQTEAPPAAPDPTDPASGQELSDLEAQIRAIEARLDGMIRKAEEIEDAPPSIREQVSSAAREMVDRFSPPVDRNPAEDGTVVDSVKELFTSDYYLRQWGRLGMRNRSEEVDDFGLDPVYERRLLPLLDFLYKSYFRVEATGVERIPSEGRCLLVANHSGTIPLDGLMLRTCIRLEHPTGRELRWLSEDFVYYLPFVGAFMNRIGAVRACQENAERLLKKENLVAVFPEGVKGIGKLYKDRYRLQRFGRGGFIRLGLRTRTPLVPCAVIGAEETGPMMYREQFVSRAVGLPYLPITPTFPLLGPAGLIPAPTKWRIVFGEPLGLEHYGADAAEDHSLVSQLAEQVRSSIQQMLDQALGQRKSVWFG